MMEMVNVSWIVTLLAIIVLFFMHSNYKAYTATVAVVINSLVTSWLAFPALSGQIVELSVFAGTFLGDIIIQIDGLSAWFILIINFTSVTGGFYGIGYLKAYNNPAPKLTLHWSLFVLFHLSMVWVCMLQNGFAFLLAWEVMSLTSMLLVIFDHNNAQTLKAGINYLVQMHISVVFLTIGFLWVYSSTGSFSFEAIRSFFQSNNNTWLFLVFFVGFGLKAGFIPLHSFTCFGSNVGGNRETGNIRYFQNHHFSEFGLYFTG
jgi:hydrogenase-4 component B